MWSCGQDRAVACCALAMSLLRPCRSVSYQACSVSCMFASSTCRALFAFFTAIALAIPTSIANADCTAIGLLSAG